MTAAVATCIIALLVTPSCAYRCGSLAALTRRTAISAQRHGHLNMADDERSADSMCQLWTLLRADAVRPLRLASRSGEWEAQAVEVEVTRTIESPGLGIMLEEYGSSDDGAGLTLVTGLVEGGNAANAATALLPGDAIVSACGTNIEGFNYDRTIDALCSLPAAPAPVLLTVKRLRKVPVVTCTVMFPPEEGREDATIRLYPGQRVRQMLMMSGIPGLGSCNDDLQCCKSCGMLIRKGKALLDPAKTQEKQMLAREPAWRLTCRAIIGPLEKDEEMVIRIRPDLDNIMASRRNEGDGEARGRTNY